MLQVGRRNRFGLGTLIVTVAILVAACGSSSNGSGQAASGATYTLVGSCPVPGSSAQCAILEYTAKDASALSGGRLKFKLSYNSALGSAGEVQTLVQDGTVQLAVTSQSDLTALVGAFDVFNLPFLFANYAEVHKVLSGPVGAKLTADLGPFHMKLLAWEDEGFSDLLSKSGFIDSVSDLKGQKVRILNDPLLSSEYSSLGAVPVPTTSTDVYTGYETGEFSVAPFSPSIILANSWQQVAKYLTVINGGLDYTENTLVASSKYLGSLPGSLRADLEKAATEATAKADAVNDAAESQGVAELKADGVHFFTMSSSNVAAWKKEAVAKMYPMFTAKYGTSLLNEVQASISG